MRFVLDECVDARVRGVIVRARHEAWTVPEAGLANSDDDVAIYASDRDAVLVTSDGDLVRRLRGNLYLQVVHLRGETPDGPAIIEQHLPEVVTMLATADEIVVAVLSLAFG